MRHSLQPVSSAALEIMRASDPSKMSWRNRLITNQDGKPKPLLANAITALRDAPEWAEVLAFNDFTLGIVARKPAPWTGATTGGEWTDNDDRLTTNWLQHEGVYVSVETAGQAVQTVAQDRRFHPVREYLDGLKWDGLIRLDGWLWLYLGVEKTEYSNTVGARFLISAVARIYQPGAKVDCCLILEGAQGIKKSTALKTLGGEWFTDEIADLGSKDASMQTRGAWIIELAELDSMSRSDVGKIKAFMSRGTDRFRLPYGKRLIESPRQCVFAGSVNHTSYLRDETGGRRFWPVACTKIDIDELQRDRDQLWAEAVHQYRDGVPWWLDTADLNKAAAIEQSDRYEGDPWDGLISNWVTDRETVSVEDLLTLCIEKAKATWTQTDKNRIARSLRAMNWQRYQVRAGTVREWRYRQAT